jgi:hypothetical protein
MALLHDILRLITRRYALPTLPGLEARDPLLHLL